MATVYNPVVPYQGVFAHPFSTQSRIEIAGFIPPAAKGFAINIKSGAGDVILHFNPRFNDRVVVLNSNLRGSWGSEQRISNFPFGNGAPFNLQIITEYNCFKLVVNGSFLGQFDHRAAFTDAKVFEITGDVQVSSIQEHVPGGSNGGMGQAMPQMGLGQAIGGAIGQAIGEIAAGYPAPGPGGYPGGGNSSFPAGPGAAGFPGGRPGYPGGAPAGYPGGAPAGYPGGAPAGYPGGAPAGFPSGVPAQGGFPGGGNSSFPAGPGAGAGAGYGGGAAPLPVPYFMPIPGGLQPGKSVLFTCSLTGNAFTVNFKCGAFEGADIAFHWNPRASDSVIVRNSHLNGEWGREERSGGFPFGRGAPVTIQFIVEFNQFKVMINGAYHSDFQFRVGPVQRIDTVEVKGEVVLLSAKIQ